MGVDKAFAEAVLEAHNKKRRLHGVAPLQLDDALNEYAQEWAEKTAANDRMEHRQKSPYGENIAMKWSSDPSFDITGEDPVDQWYDEIKDHQTWEGDPPDLRSGHFTQVVWADSKKLGVGKARTKTNKIFVVCNYDPPGNFRGHFKENVLKPK